MGMVDEVELLSRARALPGMEELLDTLGEDFEPRVLLVGGAVRDLLLGTDAAGPPDLDLMVEGEVDAVVAALGVPARSHERFGTATVEVGGISFDLARTRREIYEFPGALPKVAPAGVEEDLQRRDFTVNAIALVLTGPGRGSLVHHPRALEDLRAATLRVLHGASFRDDPTRLLRLARYAGRLRFRPDQDTERLAGEAVSGGALETISGTRLGNELRLLAREREPLPGFAWLSRLGIDSAIAPGFGLEDPSLPGRAIALLPPEGRPEIVVLAAACMGIPEDELRVLLDRLAFEASDRDAILLAATRAEKLSFRMEMAGPPSEIDWSVASVLVGPGPVAVGTSAPAGRPGILELVALAGAIHPANAAREWLVELRERRLEIGGDDLVTAGVAPGPAIAAGLAAARAAMLDGEAPDREAQLRIALDHARR